MAKKTPTREQQLRQKVIALKKTGKLPSRTPKIIADQLNQIPRTTPVTRNHVSQVLAGRNGNLEIIEAVVALAEHNSTDQLIDRIDNLLQSTTPQIKLFFGVLFFYWFSCSTTHAQHAFQSEHYLYITDATPQQDQLKQCAVQQIITDEYCYQGQPTRLRIDVSSWERWFGSSLIVV